MISAKQARHALAIAAVLAVTSFSYAIVQTAVPAAWADDESASQQQDSGSDAGSDTDSGDDSGSE